MSHNKTELTNDELMLYARQIILPDWDIEAQLHLANATVVIIGSGGLGCPVATSLVRAGVGYIRIIDDDVIELSNLQRQNLFFDEDVGQFKAETASKNLQKHNKHIKIDAEVVKITLENIAKHTQKFDLIIDCTDNFVVRTVINKHCIQYKKTFVSVAATGFSGQLTLYDFSSKNQKINQQACYHCLFGDVEYTAQACSESGVLISTTQIVGNLAVNLILQYLGKQQNLLQNKLLVWNGQTMQQKIYTYKKNEDCVLCS